MRIVPISEIFTLDPDDTIDSVVGQITDIRKFTSGKNSKGDYSFQSIKLKDNTGEIQVHLKDREELPVNQWKGRWVHIYCNQGDRGKTGLKAKDDVYKGETSRVISVTPTAHFELHEPNQNVAPPQQAPQRTQQSPPPTQQQAPRTQQQAPPPADPPPQRPPSNGNGNGHGDPVAGYRFRLAKMANSFGLCFDCAVYVAKDLKEKHGIALEPSAIKEMAVSMRITMEREGYEQQLPVKPI